MRPRGSTSSSFQTPPPRLSEDDGALDLVLETIGAAWWRWRGGSGQFAAGGGLSALRGTAPSSLAQLLGQVHRDDRAALQEAIAAGGARPRRLEYRLIGPDGAERWVLGCVRGVADDDGEAVLGVEIDIDQRQREQAALRIRADEGAKATQDKEKFVYICSHDLREPLRMISGFLGLLERRGQGLDPRARDYLALATDGATRLNGMLDDLLTYSRCGRSRQLADVALGEALAHAEGELAAEIAASGARIEANGLSTARADQPQLRRLLRELLSNAIKFRRDTPPRIVVSAERRDGGTVVAVADDGIGIAPGDRERVFEVFQRLHLRDAYPGNGIGLALCAKIAEQHGGRIWIEGHPDGTPGVVVKTSFPDA